METERPDFEFDEFFYDDEEDLEEEQIAPQKAFQAPQAAVQEEGPVQDQAVYKEAAEPPKPKPPKKKPMPDRKEAPPAKPQEKPQEKVPEEAAPEPAKESAPVRSEQPRAGEQTTPLRQGVRVRGKVTKRVVPESIVPHIQKRVDDLVVYMYEHGMLTDMPQMPASAGATMPLNARMSPPPGASYVLVDMLTDQMTAVDGNLRVGRDPSFADLIPPGNNTVSAQHAELTVKQNCLIVRDVGPNGEGSSNGTLINGVEIPKRSHFGVEAREGDVIEFSNAKYRVETL